jgi:hypothetical protein
LSSSHEVAGDAVHNASRVCPHRRHCPLDQSHYGLLGQGLYDTEERRSVPNGEPLRDESSSHDDDDDDDSYDFSYDFSDDDKE